MVGAAGHARPPQDDDISELSVLRSLDCHHAYAALRRIAIGAVDVRLLSAEREKFGWRPKSYALGSARHIHGGDERRQPSWRAG